MHSPQSRSIEAQELFRRRRCAHAEVTKDSPAPILVFVLGAQPRERHRADRHASVRAQHVDVDIRIVSLEPCALLVGNGERGARRAAVVVLGKVAASRSVRSNRDGESFESADVALDVLHACQVRPRSLFRPSRPACYASSCRGWRASPRFAASSMWRTKRAHSAAVITV